MAASQSKLLEVFSTSNIADLATSKAMKAGSFYAIDGSVRSLRITKTRISATVVGQHAYEVRLGLEGEEPAFDCSCPMGRRGDFCKHCVAVAINAQHSKSGQASSFDLAESLKAMSHSALVEALLTIADSDTNFYNQLRLAVLGASSNSDDVLAEFQQTIDDVLADGQYINYYEMPRFAARVDEVIDVIEQSVLPHEPGAAVQLMETIDERLTGLSGHVDDSDGYLSQLSVHVAEVHLEACISAKFDPIELADRLFSLERYGGDLSTFADAAFTYAELLGESGLARFRELVDQEWAKVSQKNPGDGHDYSNFRITQMALSAARAIDDQDALIEVLARDLSNPWDFVQIINRLRASERYDEAFEWAQRGVAAFTAAADSRLLKVFVEECHRRGKHLDALNAVRQCFDDQPSVERYKSLKEAAEIVHQWKTVRDAAIARIRQDIEKRSSGKLKSRYIVPTVSADSSTLVSIFLWEGDVESAWQEAQSGGCFDSLWLELAERRESSHPGDVIPIYRREVERAINLMGNDNYARAVDFLVHLRGVMKAAGQEEQFDDYVAEMRKTNKTKRNLMKLFAKRGWE